MKKIFLVFLVCMIILPLPLHAEMATDDYTWLDDLSINQLKALDAEIHRRLPEEKAENETDPSSVSSFLLGDWYTLSMNNTTYTQCSPEHPRDLRFTFSFYPSGAGKYKSEDLNNPDWKGDDIPCTYEISDQTVNVHVLFATFGFSILEDEEGPCLFRFDTQDIYRKSE